MTEKVGICINKTFTRLNTEYLMESLESLWGGKNRVEITTKKNAGVGSGLG